MKNLLLLLIIGFAAYGGYTLWNNQRTPAPAVAPKVAEATPEPPKVAQPKIEPEKPKLADEPPKPAAPVKRLAPEGVFYAIRAFSVTSDDGIRGIRAGTPVRLVKDGGATLRVTDGQQEFDAKREYLTNDLDIAAQASDQQAREQAAIAEWHRKQQALAAVNKQQNVSAEIATQERVQQLTESARAAAAERDQRIAEIRAQIGAEEAKKRSVPRHLTLQKHLDTQNEKIRQLQLELRRLGVAGALLERN